MMAPTLVRLTFIAFAIVAAFIIGIRQGVTNDFPAPQLREWKLRIDRLIDPRAMFIGNGPALAVYDVGLDDPADVVILGDSLVARGRWEEIFPGIEVHQRGIGGDTVAGVYSRLGQVIAKRPRVVVLMVGVNDVIAGNRVEDIASVYDQILAGLAGSPLVVVTSVLPCCSERSRKQIALLNRALEDLAMRRGAQYVDLASVVATSGRIAPQYTIDGIHLTAAGYKRWRDALAPYIDAQITGRCFALNQDRAEQRAHGTC